MNDDVPCRVSADLRRYEAEQEKREREWEESIAERRELAEEAIEDPDELRKILNDQPLAIPLARLMRNLSQAIEETCPGVLEGKMNTTAEVVRDLRKVREILINFHMGE